MKIFKLSIKRKGKSLTILSKAEVPLKVVVVQGKHHIVGIGELGDKHAEIEKPIIPLFPINYDVNKVAQELLKKLGLSENEIGEIMQSAVVEDL